MSGLLLAASAMAGSPVGIAVPAAGGALLNVAEESCIGIAINPASALSEGFEAYADGGLILFSFGSDLDGSYAEGKSPLHPVSGEGGGSGSFPMGSLALSIPLGKRVGLGLETWVPFATGGEYGAESPQRFHSIEGTLFVAEQDIALAAEPLPGLVLGASLRVGYASMYARSAVDTGTVLYHLTGDESLILDPLWEGERTLQGSGFASSFSAGIHWKLDAFSFHAGYRAPIGFQLEGSMDQVLSNDMTVSMAGDSYLELSFPGELAAGFRIPFSGLAILTETGWIDFSKYRYLEGQATGLELGSDSPVFQALIEDLGLDSVDELTADLEFLRDGGHRDIFYQGLALEAPLGARGSLLAGLWYSTGSIPKEYTTPGNFDFATTVFRAVGGFQATDSLQIFLSGEHHAMPDKRISSSVYALTNEADTGLLGYPGQGDYYLDISRIGLSFLVQR
jgi:long-subunit fatty acid transport protein